jgi:peptide/nickel transport system substrate-binding protein
MPVIPKHVWEKVEDPLKFDAPEAFVGSGPYVFRDFNKTRGTYLFEAFDNHYRGRPIADRLIYVKTGKTLVSLVSGQVDLANIQPEMARPLLKKGLTVIQNERGWNKKLMINHKKPPFDRKAFRQALAYAIDRREIIEKAHRGFASPASYGLLTVDHEMYNPETPDYPHDPARARKLIESLGFEKGPDGYYRKDGAPFEIQLISSNLTVAGESVADRDGEIVKKQLEEAGLKVDLVNLEQTAADSRVKNLDFDLAVSGHGGIAGDPKILNEMISSRYGAGSVNSARYDGNGELNRLLDAQMEEMNPAERKKIVFAIQKIYADELPAISLYYPDTAAAFNPEKGVEWFYTKGGLGKGIPIPQNKMSLVPKTGDRSSGDSKNAEVLSER